MAAGVSEDHAEVARRRVEAHRLRAGDEAPPAAAHGGAAD